MRKHPRMLAEAGIDKWRYAELRAVCRQYPEARRRLENARLGIVDRRPGRGAWHRPDPVGNAAAMIADMPEARTVRLIEECAAAVAESAVAPGIIESVAYGLPYDKLRRRPPCGHNQFNRARARFYMELHRRLLER